ncbi:MAG: IclR family transcriptional regulator [Peptoniphilaceae bacterium]|nr:IclR family transcriptional regulator [Peptoniphilaceae bacterium]
MEANNQSVCKAFELIEQLSEHPGGLTLTELSKALHSNKTTLFRFLSSLKTLGYVDQAEDKRYFLTLKLYSVASRVVNEDSLVMTAKPYLETLAQKVNEVVHLFVEDGIYVLYIDKVESDHTVTMRSKVGVRVPMITTAAGKAMMAEKSDEEIRRIWENSPHELLTDYTIQSLDAMMDRIRRIRESRIAYDLEENEKDIMCTATTIHGANRQVLGAISVSGPTYRMQKKMGAELDRQVKQTAELISQAMGS